MPGLFEQVVREPYKIVSMNDDQRGFHHRWELDRPMRYTAKIKNMGVDRVEVVVRNTDVQRIVDAADPERKRYGMRIKGDESQDPDDVFRSSLRAKSSIRDWCIRAKADRMLTFGTRVTIPVEVFLVRWMRFCKRYEYHTKQKFIRLAVLEPHKADKDHFHAHVATVGYFDINVALSIWHTLCAEDDDSQTVNGSINVKPFHVLNEGDDIPSIVAAYISKYMTKELSAEFNKKKFWASRIGSAEVGHVLLKSENLTDAVAECRDRLGFDLTQVIMCRTGTFFVFPDDSGVWISLRPDMRRDLPPF